MKLTAQKTIQNPNSQMMSLFDENDICLGEIHKRDHARHIVKCVNSHDIFVESLKTLISFVEFVAGQEGVLLDDPVILRAKQALKAAGEEV